MTKGATPADYPWPSRAAAWYTVAILLIAYTASYVDRAILSILVEPIQKDLGINDTQVGLLHGFAFVIFYVSLGIPLGYAADRRARKGLVVISIAFWSLMTAVCGLTGNFWQLFAARIGVGVGEAGLSPASYSLISDYFPPEKRSAAMGVYTLGIYLGSGMAILLGGIIVVLVGAQPFVTLPLLGVIRSWHVVFFAVGLPGFLVAALACSLREPARRLAAGAKTGAADWKSTLAHIRKQGAAYSFLAIGFAFLGTPYNVALLWARPYLTRHFGMTPSRGAVAVGLIMMMCATSGILLGSLVADRWQARGRRDATLRVGMLSALCVIVPIVAFPFMPTIPTALAALAAVLFFGATAFGAAPASLQLITPNRMRAMTSAIYLLAINLVGLMAGPVVTGMLTDYVFHDPKAVGYSAAIVGAGSAAIAALCFALGLKPYRAALEAQKV